MAEATQSLAKEMILKDYKDIFSGIGALPGVYDIELDDSVPPVQNRPRRIPHTMRAAVQEKLQYKPWRRMVGSPRSTHPQSG